MNNKEIKFNKKSIESKSCNHDNSKEEYKNTDINQGEDKTKYGETIPSMFNWITLDDQKKRAEELNNITKK